VLCDWLGRHGGLVVREVGLVSRYEVGSVWCAMVKLPFPPSPTAFQVVVVATFCSSWICRLTTRLGLVEF